MKTYLNHPLRSEIEKTVNNMSVEDKYKPYIIDILLRRARQFSLSPDQIRIDLDTISKSLEKIEIGKTEEGVAGCYRPWEKKIIISSEDDWSKTIYETLTHEIYHALTHDENGKDRLGGVNQFTNQNNKILLEAFVEKAAYRTVFSGKSKNPYWNKKAGSYKNITFVMGMLEATYGVTEQELLEHGIQSREELASFLAKKAGTTKTEELRFLDELEANLSEIHRISGIKKKSELDKKNMALALEKMEYFCANKMQQRLINLDYDSITPSDMEDFQFNYNKLNYVINHTKRYLKIGKYTKDSDSICVLRRAIYQTKTIIEAGIKSGRTNPDLIIEMAKKGNLHLYDDFNNYTTTLKKYGIVLKDEDDIKKPFKISRKTIKRNQEDNYYTSEWENQQICHTFSEEMGYFKDFREQWKKVRENVAYIKSMIVNRYKALPDGNNDDGQSLFQVKETKKASWALTPIEYYKTRAKIKKIAKRSNSVDKKQIDENDEHNHF